MNRKPHERRIPRPTAGLFVTGTDTGVGKTHVAALIAKGLKDEGREVGVYKPVASGCARDAHGNLMSDDATLLWEAAGRPGELERVCPQKFAAPLAPHLAARAEEKKVDGELLRLGLDYWRERSDIVVVEGAGGLFSPLSDDELNIDLALDLSWPIVVVAANRLGVIHATLALCHAVAHYNRKGADNGRGLQIAALVLNDALPADADKSRALNADELKKWTEGFRIRSFTTVPHDAQAFEPAIEWMSLSAH